MEINLANSDDLPAYFEHLVRFNREAITDPIIFSPFDEPPHLVYEEIKEDRTKSWSKSTEELGWERCFVLKDKGNKTIVGELVLTHRPPLTTSLHRALLMMGIERSYRGRGLGKQMLSKAIEWVTLQTKLEWLELFVFDKNGPAKNMYSQFGFREISKTPDKFRIRGEKITDVEMVLDLKSLKKM